MKACDRILGFLEDTHVVDDQQDQTKKFKSCTQQSSVLRLAFVGCGGILGAHTSAIREINEFLGFTRLNVVAACDLNKNVASEAFANDPDVEIFDDFDKCLASVDFDVAVLLLPHDIHESYCRKALGAGKHVYLEKPISTDSESSRRIVDMAMNSEKVVFVGENSQWWPEVKKAQELLPSIGSIVFARACYNEVTTSVWTNNDMPSQSWRNNASKTGGGIVMDGGLHWIHSMRKTLGEIKRVVHHNSFHVEHMQGESKSHTLLEFESGLVGTLDCLMSNGPMTPHPFFSFLGSTGEITIAGSFDGGITHLDSSNTLHDLGSQGGYFGSFTPTWKEFVKIVERGRSCEQNLLDTVQDVRVVEAMYRSHKTASWQPVEPFGLRSPLYCEN